MADAPPKPDFASYHRSLADELYATKDRIRNLVRHWPTDGEHKEAALRSVLRRVLPPSLVIGRGFVVNAGAASTQADILIVDGDQPTLFRDGDLLIVTPDAVRAVVEVKTELRGAQAVAEAALKLARIGHVCRTAVPTPWLGLFAYEPVADSDVSMLRAAQHALRHGDEWVRCICCGRDALVARPSLAHGGWRAYGLAGLAPSWFIGDLVHTLMPNGRDRDAFAWFAGGEEADRLVRAEIKVDGDVTRRNTGG